MKQITLLLTVLALAGCGGNGPLGGRSAPPETQAGELDLLSEGEALEGIETTTLEEPPTVEDAVEEEVASAETPAPAPAAETPAVETPAAPTETVREATPAPAPTPAPAAAPEAAGDGRLGTTVASIGAADEPGFWIRTPLVSETASGRLFYPASGRTVQVQLIPSGGASGSGSEVSLAALRLLDAPLDGLPELVVYRN